MMSQPHPAGQRSPCHRLAEIATASKGGSLTTTMFSSLLDGKEPSQNFKEKRVFAQ